MKILVVDDDVFIRELLPMILTAAGHSTVDAAASGMEALELMSKAETPYDCLLLDINMPGIDGIELTGQIRRLAIYRKTPILILTAMTEKKYMEEAFRAGATDYLTKPFDVAEVGARLRLIEELVAARRKSDISDGDGNTASRADLARHSFALKEPVELEGKPDCVDFPALSNYLQHLSRASLESVQVLAVKIDQIEALYRESTTEEFLYVLQEVAGAIGKVMHPTGCVLAYSGNGVFIIISNKSTLEPSKGLENEIQEIIDGLELEYDNGSPVDVAVSIGNPIRPITNRCQRVRRTFDRAIERAENRARAKITERQMLNIRTI